MTPEEIAGICDKLAEGQSLRAICRKLKIDESTARYHLNKDEHFPQYTRAREFQGDAYFDGIVDIADGTAPEAVGKDREDRRLMIEARKWAAGKLKGKYSEKSVHEHSGPGGGAIPIFTAIERRIVRPGDSDGGGI